MNYKILSLVLLLSLVVVGIYFYLKPEQISNEQLNYPQTFQTKYGLLEKDYQPAEEKVTLTNEDKTTLSQIKLVTPRVFMVGAGYQKVAEIEFTSYGDFKQYLSNSYFELYDKNNNMKPIQRQLDFKYLTTEQVSVDDFTTQCSDNSTGNAVCSQIKSGSHLETREAWKDVSEHIFKSGELVKIGIFTDVQINDNVEWIPTIYGVKISEWASWQASLENGLVSWYKLDESSGSAIDSLGRNNGTNEGASYLQGGKINNSYGFNISENDKVRLGNNISLRISDNLTIAGWIKTKNNAENVILGKMATFNGHSNYILQVNSSGNLMMNVYSSNSVDGTTCVTSYGSSSNSTLSPNVWYFVTTTYNSATKELKVYVNGVQSGTTTLTENYLCTNWVDGGAVQNAYIGGSVAAGSSSSNSTIDEIGIWNRTLTSSEITNLYNSGNGCTYQLCGIENIDITLTSPANNTNFSTNINYFVSNVNKTGAISIVNVSLLINGTIAQTNTSGLIGTYNFSKTLSDGNYNWTIIAYGNDSIKYNATNETLFFIIDTIFPTFIVNSSTQLNYGRVNNTLQLNWTVTDTNLNKCWYDYNGTNITLGTCTSGSPNLANITLTTRKYALLYANDTAGNLNSTNHSWSYKVFENERFFNNQTAETAYESYALNLTANSSLSSVKLFINSSLFASLTQSSGIWNYSTDIPLNLSGNNSFYFNFTYGGSYIISDNSTQLVNQTFFDICNSTLTTQSLNITFKDENSLTSINASIPTSTFIYYLGTGAINKTLTYSNTTNNYNYTFCATPSNKAFYVLPVVQYKRISDYPQRIWEPSLRTYNSTVTTQVLYLLSTTDGIYVTYQVVDNIGTQISNVNVEATRIISGETVIIGTGTTDAAGLITFWMNPDFIHTVTFEKTGYTTFTLNHFPTQPTYTVTLGSSSLTGITDYLRGISWVIKPVLGTTLPSNTMTNFNLTLNSSVWSLDSYGFTLTNQDSIVIGGNTSSSSTGGTILNIINTSDNSHIFIQYYWVINGTQTDATSGGWFIYSYTDSNWSIKNFFTDLSTYSSQGIFGIDQDSLNLIIFIIIFVSVGIMSYKFSLTSPATISGIIFALVFFFDYGLNMINVGIGIPHFPTIFTGLIMVGLIIKEVTT